MWLGQVKYKVKVNWSVSITLIFAQFSLTNMKQCLTDFVSDNL